MKVLISMSDKKRAFLGGTCNGSLWREELIPQLTIDYFNPVVKDWTPADQAKELQERATCSFCVYVLTPLMTGVYSIAEVIDDSNKRPHKTFLCVLGTDAGKTFSAAQEKSLKQVARLAKSNGARVADSLADLAALLNKG